jgi:hypothetical protein
MHSTSIAFDVEYSPSQEEAHKAEALWSRKHAGRLAIAAILPGILLIATPFLLLGNSGNHENSDKVVWYFSYAHYLRGEWLSMCNPAWKLKPEFLCKKS